MAGLVDPAADMVDVGRCSADGRGQLFLLGVIHLDDVAVNGHLAELGSHIASSQLRHFAFDQPMFVITDAGLDADRSCSVWHKIIPFLKFLSEQLCFFSIFNGHFLLKFGGIQQKIPSTLQRTNLCCLSGKFENISPDPTNIFCPKHKHPGTKNPTKKRPRLF